MRLLGDIHRELGCACLRLNTKGETDQSIREVDNR